MRLINRTPLYMLPLLFSLLPALGLAGSDEDTSSYIPLKPPVVVNLASSGRPNRYLKLDAQFFVETSRDAELVTLHLPLLRDRMISLLGGRDGDKLMSMEEREQLRSELLLQLRETMIRQAGAPAISAVYFTGFIVQ